MTNSTLAAAWHRVSVNAHYQALLIVDGPVRTVVVLSQVCCMVGGACRQWLEAAEAIAFQRHILHKLAFRMASCCIRSAIEHWMVRKV